MRKGIEHRNHTRKKPLTFKPAHIDRLIIIYGIRRSGNHATVNWLIPHFSGTTSYLHSFDFERELRFCENFLLHENDVFRLQARPHFLSSEIAGRPYTSVRPKTLIVGAENYDITKKNSFFESVGLTYDRLDEILLLRDYRNNAASLSKREKLLKPDEFKRLWEIYAREFLGETSHIENAVKWSFNDWFKDKSYRESLAERLGLSFTDAGLNEVSPAARGSSFDLTSLPGQKMKVLERHKEVDLEYDPDLIKLSEKIFNG